MEGPQLTPELKEFLESPLNGYSSLRVISGRGICGVQRFIYTVGLTYGIDETGYKGRWCYPNMAEATGAINEWDGVGDPPGEWIKFKGDTEYSRIKSKWDE